MKEESKYGYVVTVERKVRTMIVCKNCTITEATNDPFKYATAQYDIGMDDWSVLKVEENE